MSRRSLSLAGLLATLLALTACGASEPPGQPPVEPPPEETPDTTAPVSSVDTPAGTIAAKTVTISASEAATIHYTLDGADPRQGSPKTGVAPVAVEISRTSTLRFYAVDDAGNAEAETHMAAYFVPVKGRVAGKVVLDASVGTTHTMMLGLYDRAPGQGVQPIATSPIELAAGSSETTYSFLVTAAGTYHVMAWVNLNDNGAADAGDLYASPAVNPVTLDFADPLAWGVETADIYLGRGDPAFGSIAGTVHLTASMAADPVTVVLLDQPLGTNGAKALGYARAGKPDAQGRASYALYNLKPGSGHLVAVVDIGNDGNDGNNAYAVYPINPLEIDLADPAKKDRTGADLFVGVANPERGSVSGTITLNAAYAGGYITVAAFEGPLNNAVMRSAARVMKTDSDTVYTYLLGDLPAGTYTVAVYYGNGRAESYRLHPVQAVIDLGSTKDLTGRDFALGVGGVSGTVKVKNLPVAAKRALVMARGAGEAAGYAQGELGAADGDGVRSLTYEIFGLDDGVWNMRALVDENGNGSIEDEGKALSVHNGDPGSVTITGGSSESSTFDIEL